MTFAELLFPFEQGVNNSSPALAGIIRACPCRACGARFGGQNGSAAATEPSVTSGIVVLKAAFMVSMNVFATTAYPVLVGWIPSSAKKPPRKAVVPV